MTHWQDVTSLYQIYPRSFQDLNGDGIGDLNGITLRLDYLAQLGVDALWLSPFFTSPMRDYGYDVADYQAVDPTFGTMGDFQMLIDEAHQHDIKVMIDLVPCHTSDQHPWFRESRSSQDNPKRDYYVWRDPVDGREPNNWRSLAGGRSWTFDVATRQYYLHSFLPEQPDLNWDNPAVRREMKDIVRFWFDMGVDGMRVDAIWGISKDPKLGDDTQNWSFDGDNEHYGAFIHDHCKYGPYFQEYLRELAGVCDEYDDRRMVFEFYPDEQLGDIWEQYKRVAGSHPRASTFFMEHRQDDWHAERTGQRLTAYLSALGPAQPFFCVGNHDQPRVTTRLGDERARALQFLNLTCPGISVIYYGDEIGMENGIWDDATITDERQRARTPMQWNSSRFAGFSAVTPWLPVHVNHKTHNVKQAQTEQNSLLTLHKQLLALRHNWPLLSKGSFEPFLVDNGYVLAIYRAYNEEIAYIFMNFADQPQQFHTPEIKTIIASTHKGCMIYDKYTLCLPAYGAAIVK